MKVYAASQLTACLLLGLFYTRTDEIPVILGFTLVLGFILGFAFPKRSLYSWVLLGLMGPLTESLIPILHIRVPFAAGHPGPAFVLLLPALLGTFTGRCSRPAKASPLQ